MRHDNLSFLECVKDKGTNKIIITNFKTVIYFVRHPYKKSNQNSSLKQNLLSKSHVHQHVQHLQWLDWKGHFGPIDKQFHNIKTNPLKSVKYQFFKHKSNSKQGKKIKVDIQPGNLSSSNQYDTRLNGKFYPMIVHPQHSVKHRGENLLYNVANVRNFL